MFFFVTTCYLWLKALNHNNGNMLLSIFCAVVYYCLSSTHGIYIFVANLIPLHVCILICTGFYSIRLHACYGIFFITSTIMSMHVPFIGFRPSLKVEFFLPIKKFFNTRLAIDGFFIISGFLIAKSFEVSLSTKDYLIRRIKRIFPAYFFVILISAFFLFFISSKSSTEYFFNGQFWSYLLANLSFQNYWNFAKFRENSGQIWRKNCKISCLLWKSAKNAWKFTKMVQRFWKITEIWNGAKEEI